MPTRYPIPIKRFIKCPFCNQESWIQSTIYPDHEANLCTRTNQRHEWIVNFSEYGQEYDKHVHIEKDRIKNLVSDLIGFIRNYKWSKIQTEKDRKAIETIIRNLLRIHSSLNDLVLEVSDEEYGEEEVDKESSKATSIRSKDYPWEFRRKYQGRIFEGIVFLENSDIAKSLVGEIIRRFNLHCISVKINKSEAYPERYIIMLPRDPGDGIENFSILEATKYINDRGSKKFRGK